MGNECPASHCASVRTGLGCERSDTSQNTEPKEGKYTFPGHNSTFIHITAGLFGKDLDQYLRVGRWGCYYVFQQLVFQGVTSLLRSHTSITSQLSANTKSPTSYTLLCGAKPMFLWRPNSLNYGPAVTK